MRTTQSRTEDWLSAWSGMSTLMACAPSNGVEKDRLREWPSSTNRRYPYSRVSNPSSHPRILGIGVCRFCQEKKEPQTKFCFSGRTSYKSEQPLCLLLRGRLDPWEFLVSCHSPHKRKGQFVSIQEKRVLALWKKLEAIMRGFLGSKSLLI